MSIFLVVPLWFWLTFAALFGLIIGSFLNVCIYRMPAGLSIVHPRSRCSSCGHQLAWWENIPVMSFLFLGGRCLGCKKPFSWRYPLVELLTAAFSMLVWWWFQDPWAYLGYFVLLICPLIVITFIDLDHYIIPDSISLPGIAVGTLVHVWLSPASMRMDALIQSGIGILVGGGVLWLVAWSYEKLKKQEGLGGGDVKLMAMLGAFFGWKAVFFLILLSSLLGSVIGVSVMLAQRKDMQYAVPFGPFIALAAIIYLFWGEMLLNWYWGFF